MIFLELFLAYVRVGFSSFGGQSMIPLVRAEMVAHGWLTPAELADIVAIAEMTPGSVSTAPRSWACAPRASRARSSPLWARCSPPSR